MKKFLFLFILLFIINNMLTSQNIGINVPAPLGKLHIKNNSTTSTPQLRLTEEGSDFARIKMESAVNANSYWDIAGKADVTTGFSILNFYFSNPSNSGDRLSITGIGDVGIGTTNPQAKLDILSEGEDKELLRFSTERPWVFKQKDSGVNSKLALQSTVDGKDFEILSLDGTTKAAIFRLWNNNPSVFLAPDSGKVGIGTVNPVSKLDVNGVATLDWLTCRNDLIVGDLSNPVNHNISLLSGLDKTTRILLQEGDGTGFYQEYNGDEDRLDIGSHLLFDTPRISIFHNGNVGIGNANPNVRLDVNGDTDITGILTLDKPGGGGVIKVLEDEALWSNGSYFKWGAGGFYNHFVKDIWIGESISGAPKGGLHIKKTGVAALILESGVGFGTKIQLTDDASGTNNDWTIKREAGGTGVLQIEYNGSTRMEFESAGPVHIPSSLSITGTMSATNIDIGDYANMQYNTATGEFFYDNSSARYKENITNLDVDFKSILAARPVQYTRPGTPGRIEIGYIAEEMEALGLSHLIGYGKEGLVENFNYEKMILYVVEVLKDQNKTIENQKEINAQLHKKIDNQQAQIDQILALLQGQTKG